jgi:23S rRNA pseudouridine1911/1915/1917 synthase
LLEIELETGRHHQIRAQLASLGFPIQGDLKYGAPRSNKDGTISLHARTLTLQHPVTKETLLFTSDPEKVGLWKSVLSDSE